MIRAALVSALLATTAVAAPLGPAHATSGPDKPIPGCKVGVWADNFTDAGQLAWQRSLPVPTRYDQGDSLTPVAVGGVSVFADGNALYGLRLSDGHTAWRHTFPDTSTTLTAGTTGTIESLAVWKGSVIVLLGTSSDAPSMVAHLPQGHGRRGRGQPADHRLQDLGRVAHHAARRRSPHRAHGLGQVRLPQRLRRPARAGRHPARLRRHLRDRAEDLPGARRVRRDW
jgi:hypothetical protein